MLESFFFSLYKTNLIRAVPMTFLGSCHPLWFRLFIFTSLPHRNFDFLNFLLYNGFAGRNNRWSGQFNRMSNLLRSYFLFKFLVSAFGLLKVRLIVRIVIGIDTMIYGKSRKLNKSGSCDLFRISSRLY